MISDAEKQKMLRAYSVGPKLIGYLEMIGIERLSDLKEANAMDLALSIDEALGKKHMVHKLALEAFENLITLAIKEDEQ